MFLVGGPNRFSGHPVFAIDFYQVSPDQMVARGHASNPWATALKVGGAIKDTPRHTYMRGADRELRCPLQAKDYEVCTFA